MATQTAIVFSSSGAIHYPTESINNLQLHIEGRLIKDSLGNTVFLKGVNFRQNEWYVGQRGVATQFDYMKEWGVNCVRFVICTQNWLENVDWGMGPYRTVIEDMVDLCAERGIYVNLMVHHLTREGWTNNWGSWSEDDFLYLTSMWKSVATTLKSKDNLIYNIYNEPSSYSSADYQTRIQNIIDEIRTIDPDVICDVAGVSTQEQHWPRTYAFEQTNPINRPNVIYGEHLYGAYSPYSKTVVRDMLKEREMDWMVSNNRCVVVTEFGVEDSTLPDGLSWYRNLMEVANEDGYAGFLAWAWYPSGVSDGQDYYLLDSWDGTPSMYGNILQEYLH